jgi:fumarate reductase subunit C
VECLLKITIGASGIPVRPGAAQIRLGGNADGKAARMIRRYWFELGHGLLWVAAGVLMFYQLRAAIFVGLFALLLTVVSLAVHAAERRAASCLLILAAPLLVLAAVLPLNRSQALNWVEFYSARPTLEARFKQLPPLGHEPRLVAFHMDDRGWLPTGPTIFETLVYDQTDEIGKPIERWSDAWRLRASGRLHFHSILQPVSPTHAITVTPMGGHWFWVEQMTR